MDFLVALVILIVVLALVSGAGSTGWLPGDPDEPF